MIPNIKEILLLLCLIWLVSAGGRYMYLLKKLAVHSMVVHYSDLAQRVKPHVAYTRGHTPRST